MKKIKVLFHNQDNSGVYYFRALTPSEQLYKSYPDLFEVEINKAPELSSVEYLSKFDIVHFHRLLLNDVFKFKELQKELNSCGTKLVLDIDDYWVLDKSHPLYGRKDIVLRGRVIEETIKAVNYVSTTSEIFAEKIRKFNKNVIVLPNSINPEIMDQFVDRRDRKDDVVNISYVAGSSHLQDVKLLEGVFNRLYSDPELKGKFRIILAGWDYRGNKIIREFNEELKNELLSQGLFTRNVVTQINNGKSLLQIKEIPTEIAEKYKTSVFIERTVPFKPHESVYYDYEKILTDNHKFLNRDHIEYLKLFKVEDYYGYDTESFMRVWTKHHASYAKVLDKTDICLAPLYTNEFNKMKSNLKQIEAMSRKLPIICSNVEPYNVDGVHMKNCVLVDNKKNSDKKWASSIKKLILDKELRESLGQQLYDDFKDMYSLEFVTEKRKEFYLKILNND